jgi:hypothetical protein
MGSEEASGGFDILDEGLTPWRQERRGLSGLWSPSLDRQLLAGVLLHGYSKWKAISFDPQLGLLAAIHAELRANDGLPPAPAPLHHLKRSVDPAKAVKWVKKRVELVVRALVCEEMLQRARAQAAHRAQQWPRRAAKQAQAAHGALRHRFAGVRRELDARAGRARAGEDALDAAERATLPGEQALLARKQQVLAEAKAAHGDAARFCSQVDALKAFLSQLKPEPQAFCFGRAALQPYERGLAAVAAQATAALRQMETAAAAQATLTQALAASAAQPVNAPHAAQQPGGALGTVASSSFGSGVAPPSAPRQGTSSPVPAITVDLTDSPPPMETTGST